MPGTEGGGGVDGGMVALLTVVSGIAGWLGKWVLELYRARAEVRAKVRKDAIDEWRELLADRDAQLERHEGAQRESQEAIRHLQADREECRDEVSELRTFGALLLEWGRRSRSALAELGKDPGPLPDAPPGRRASRPDPDFLARQAQQSAALVHEADQAARPPGGPAA